MAETRTVRQIDDVLIEEIVRRVLSVAQPAKIILFGSAATGQMTPDSDIDLLLVEGRPSNPRRESVQVGDALRGMGFPFDVVVISTDWFEASKDLVGGIAYPAHKHGKVIYDAA